MKKKITYGYARVSTISQHDDRQRLAIVEFGVEEIMKTYQLSPKIELIQKKNSLYN